MNFLLGIDIGTSSSKGVLVTEHGLVIASHSVPHGVAMPRPGWFEQDADGVWWGDFVQICRHLLTISAIDPKQIAAIGVSTTSPCVLPVDRAGAPLRPGILYGIDTRATQEIAQLEASIGADVLLKRYNSKLSSQSASAKIVWLRTHEPELWAKTHLILGSAGYILYKLTGEAALDIYDATGYPPLFDMHNLRWDESMAPLIAPLDQLPRLTWTCEIAGHVHAQAAQSTGLAAGTPVITGTADAASEAISAGLTQVGDMMVMYGSSIFFILKCANLHTSPTFSGAPFLEPKTFVATGAMSTAGTLTKWFRDQFAPLELAAEQGGGENAFAELAKLAASSPRGANGLLALPHFAGARSPQHNPDALGAIFGLTLRHTRGDLYRAFLEAVGYGIRHNLDAMRAEGLVAQRILAVGGGTHNPLWMQIVSDIANIEQHIPDQQIGASYGDAFLAGIGVGMFRSTAEVASWVKPKAIIRPDPAAHQSYAEFYQLYRELDEQVTELMRRLRGLMK